MNKTRISWTDYSWNPVSGCTPVSAGCAHCYAREWSKRWNRSFEVILHHEKLDEPQRRDKNGNYKLPSGAKVFVNSMSDLFHKDVPLTFVDAVMAMINSRPDVTFQILTKRPERAIIAFEHDYMGSFPDNVWLGVSVESENQVDRIDMLRYSSARVRFVSFEPLLSGIPDVNLAGIGFIIVGGESGPHRRPFQLDWARDLLLQARKYGSAFWFKQISSLRPACVDGVPDDLMIREFPEETHR